MVLQVVHDGVIDDLFAFGLNNHEFEIFLRAAVRASDRFAVGENEILRQERYVFMPADETERIEIPIERRSRSTDAIQRAGIDSVGSRGVLEDIRILRRRVGEIFSARFQNASNAVEIPREIFLRQAIGRKDIDY